MYLSFFSNQPTRNLSHLIKENKMDTNITDILTETIKEAPVPTLIALIALSAIAAIVKVSTP